MPYKKRRSTTPQEAILKNLAKVVRDRREALGLRGLDLARLSGLSLSVIHNIEVARTDISLTVHLIPVCHALDLIPAAVVSAIAGQYKHKTHLAELQKDKDLMEKSPMKRTAKASEK